MKSPFYPPSSSIPISLVTDEPGPPARAVVFLQLARGLARLARSPPAPAVQTSALTRGGRNGTPRSRRIYKQRRRGPKRAIAAARLRRAAVVLGPMGRSQAGDARAQIAPA